MSLIVLPVNKTKQKINDTINIIKCCSEHWENAQSQLYHREEKKVNFFCLAKFFRGRIISILNTFKINVTGTSQDVTMFETHVSLSQFHENPDSIEVRTKSAFSASEDSKVFFRLKFFQGL